MKILIIDDDIESSLVISKKLKKRGHQVKCAESADKALEYVRIVEDLDLILLDIIMPKVSGIELLVKLRKSHSALELPIIMLTNIASVNEIVCCLKAGANDFLIKPVDIDLATARINTQISAVSLYKEHLLKENMESLNNMIRVCNDELNDPLSIMFILIRKLRKNPDKMDMEIIKKLNKQIDRIAFIVKNTEEVANRTKIPKAS